MASRLPGIYFQIERATSEVTEPSTLTHLARGLRLRCPACGKGRIYRSFFSVHSACAACGSVYQRDPGDWSGGAEIALVLTVLFAVVGLVLVSRLTEWDPMAELVVVLAGTAIAFPLFYRHVKGFWIGVVRSWEGPDPQPNPLKDPEWFTALWEREH